MFSILKKCIRFLSPFPLIFSFFFDLIEPERPTDPFFLRCTSQCIPSCECNAGFIQASRTNMTCIERTACAPSDCEFFSTITHFSFFPVFWCPVVMGTSSIGYSIPWWFLQRNNVCTQIMCLDVHAHCSRVEMSSEQGNVFWTWRIQAVMGIISTHFSLHRHSLLWLDGVRERLLQSRQLSAPAQTSDETPMRLRSQAGLAQLSLHLARVRER